jgi:DNA polymerase I-like protein with 3'-5' exonuclease and polymerase domains
VLEQRFTFPFEAEDAYELSIPKCASWNSAKTKILIFMQTVDSRDLKAKGMLGDKTVRTCAVNALKYALETARRYDENMKSPAYVVAPFNRKRHLNLKGSARKGMENEFAAHAHKLIRKLKPTHVLVAGDEAFHAMWPQIEQHAYKRGWVHELKSGDHKVKVTSTLDFSRLLEKQGQFANLLGFWCRHLTYLMLGRHPHSLKGFVPTPRYIDTIEKFDRLMDKVEAEEIIAVDTETRDLSVLGNALYTIQFALESSPEYGYVIPIDHPLQDCWTKEQRKYIKQRLRKLFRSKQKKLLVGFNIMYDLRVIRRCLKLAIIWHDVWEITAGEHELDENISDLANFNSKPGNLAAVLCSYECDYYYTADFGKEDRSTIAAVKPTDKGFQKYGAMDVQSLLKIRHQQIRRASKFDIEGRNYKPYFIRHMIDQMGDTAHMLSHLREDGSLVDIKYLKHLVSTESPLRTEMKRLAAEFRKFPEVQEANQRILGESGMKAKGLFGKAKASAKWALSMTKPNHLRTLFFDVMGMEPVNETKQGEKSVDKAFVAEMEARNHVVAAYGEYAKLGKLMSTYAKGWLKKLRSNRDSIEDQHLRADYSFFDVTTGRLNSKNPNLQQIPSRGKLAKIIKRMFVARKGTLLVRFDYSAHEVRVWSYVGKDQVLAGIFKIGQKLRQAFIQNPSDENRKAVKEKGDLHILNVKRFFNKQVDKDHPLRDAVKAVIFGAIYSKGAETLGEDTKMGDRQALMKRIGAKDATAQDIAKAEKELKALMAEDRTPYAQDILDKLFKEFKKSAAWTEKMKKLAVEKYYVYSPIGRVRRLYAAMTGDRTIINKQARRGSNAPIQGFASEIGIKAGRLIIELYYKELPKFCEILGIEYDEWALRVPYNRVVHDANYFSVIYPMILPFIHILQYASTYGVTKVYAEEFNVEFGVEPEIEIEVGARDDNTYKWDWSIPQLVTSLLSSVDEAEKDGLLEGTRAEVVKQIFEPWRNKKMRAYLQKKYPLLGISELDEQIKAAIKPVYEEKKCKTSKVAT